MFVRNLRYTRAACMGGPALLLTLAGCGDLFDFQDIGGSRPRLNLSTLGVGDESTHFESDPNEAFEAAEYVPLDGQSSRVIRGVIDGPDDVDVYDLGPVAAGDRIIVDMTAEPSLDGAIALFDEAGSALLINDHRNIYLGTSTPFIDVIIRHPSPSCYIVVAGTPGFESSGAYGLLARRQFPVDVPAPRPDTVLLVFGGAGSVKIGSRAPVDVPPFDAADVDPAFTGMTDDMVAEIVARVREDFAGLDLLILSTSEGAVYEPGMTRVFFGTFDEALLGVAEGVDEFNASNDQRAIVFTDTFAAFSRLRPSLGQMSQAIANVASHEIGHLLGMVHTSDPDGIMDVTASLKKLMQDQVIRWSPVYEVVFPVGYQDGVQYLYDVVGGHPDWLATKPLRVREKADDHEKDAGPPARLTHRFSTCGFEGH